jgi:hypothetical protein
MSIFTEVRDGVSIKHKSMKAEKHDFLHFLSIYLSYQLPAVTAPFLFKNNPKIHKTSKNNYGKKLKNGLITNNYQQK